ncbi:MAG TPA: glycosyltransferase family 4 protein [Pyrinomonadaceae bacterium]|jgi:glycosyltransferase involved in cell wall biosynthesis
MDIDNDQSNTEPAPSSEPTVTLVATFRVYDGYGSMGEYMALGMSRAGARVNAIPILIDLEGTSVEFQEIIKHSRADAVGAVLYFCGPCEWLDPYRDAEDLFINTMWEADRLPSVWSERLNLARAVIVPSRFLVDAFRQSGVNVPIEVVAQGVDPEIYHYEQRPERESLTTLMVGTVDERKHIDEGIAAWKKVFADDPHARLIIKSRFQKGNYAFQDPRIIFSHASEPTRGIVHWYREADVLLALGNEGFGLPLVEGMATGLPVIALDSEGQADLCADARDCLLPVKPVRRQAYHDAYWGTAGMQGVPGVDDVAERLRWVATHRDEARALGAAASRWVHKHRSIWTMGAAVLDIMENYSNSKRRLR